MTAAGFVDPELRDRAQPAGQSIRACTGLHGLGRPTSQGRDLGVDDDCSWAWDLLSTQTMVAITWARAKSCLMHLLTIPLRVWQARFHASLCPTP
jgi:hypothetical protein